MVVNNVFFIILLLGSYMLYFVKSHDIHSFLWYSFLCSNNWKSTILLYVHRSDSSLDRIHISALNLKRSCLILVTNTSFKYLFQYLDASLLVPFKTYICHTRQISGRNLCGHAGAAMLYLTWLALTASRFHSIYSHVCFAYVNYILRDC